MNRATATATLTRSGVAAGRGTGWHLTATESVDCSGEPLIARTAAGRRAVQRRRARVSAARRPPSGLLPSGGRTAAVVTADRADEVRPRPFTVGRWARLCTTVCLTTAAVVVLAVVLAPRPAVSVERVTVAAGDSLWTIAERAQPGVDPRPLVDQIERMNQLPGDDVAVGVVLQVPTVTR